MPNSSKVVRTVKPVVSDFDTFTVGSRAALLLGSLALGLGVHRMREAGLYDHGDGILVRRSTLRGVPREAWSQHTVVLTCRPAPVGR